MRSLAPVLARVERLVGPTTPETFLISWKDRNQRCPACDADLKAHAAQTALAAAKAGQRPGEGPPRFVWFSTDELATCPRCGARLSEATDPVERSIRR